MTPTILFGEANTKFSEDVGTYFPNVKPTDTNLFIPAIKRFADAMLKETDQTLKEFALEEDKQTFKRLFTLNDEEKNHPTLPNEVVVEVVVLDELEDQKEASSEESGNKVQLVALDMEDEQKSSLSKSSNASQTKQTETEDGMESEGQKELLTKIKNLVKLNKLDSTGTIFPYIQFSVGLGDYDEDTEDIWNTKDALEEEEEEERKLQSDLDLRKDELLSANTKRDQKNILRKNRERLLSGSQLSDTNTSEKTPEKSVDQSNNSEELETQSPRKRRVGMFVMEYYPHTIASLILGVPNEETIEQLKVEDSENSGEISNNESAQNSASSNDEDENSQAASLDVLLEGINMLQILLKKSSYLNKNGYFADFNCNNIIMEEIAPELKESIESQYIELYPYEDGLYNFILKSTYDIGSFTPDQINTLRFPPEKNIFELTASVNHQVIILYQLGMWFVEYYLHKSGRFGHTEYVNKVFSLLAEPPSDSPIFDSLDTLQLEFLFPEDADGQDLEMGNLEASEDEAEAQDYNVENPFLFNFMNYLLKKNRKEEKDVFLAYYKSNPFTVVSTEVIQNLYDSAKPELAGVFLRFFFNAKFERFIIDSEKQKYVNPRSEFKTRIEGLNEEIDKVIKAMDFANSEHEDNLEGLKEELTTLGEQTLRNNLVDILLSAIRNLVLGYHQKVETLEYLAKSLQRIRDEQGKWARKLDSVQQMDKDAFGDLKVEEFLEVVFRDPVSREDSFRLLVV